MLRPAAGTTSGAQDGKVAKTWTPCVPSAVDTLDAT